IDDPASFGFILAMMQHKAIEAPEKCREGFAGARGSQNERAFAACDGRPAKTLRRGRLIEDGAEPCCSDGMKQRQSIVRALLPRCVFPGLLLRHGIPSASRIPAVASDAHTSFDATQRALSELVVAGAAVQHWLPKLGHGSLLARSQDEEPVRLDHRMHSLENAFLRRLRKIEKHIAQQNAVVAIQYRRR